MALKRDYFADISPAKESWNIVGRVVQLWYLEDFDKTKLPYSMEIVLMDEKGDKIQASTRRALMYKFEKDLKEGLVYSISALTIGENGGNFRSTKHPYKLHFQYRSKLALVADHLISSNVYSFVPATQILDKDFDMTYLVDVMGLMTSYDDEREYERGGVKSKLKTIHLDCDGTKIDCTLLGTYAEELITYLKLNEEDNPVVIVQLARVKLFQGKHVLQNAMNSTKVIYNPKCSLAFEFKKRFRIKVRVIDHTDSATFVIFDRDASQLLNKSCADMIEALNKRTEPLNVPEEIYMLLDKTFLFKVEFQNVVSSKFEPSYRVKRICHDPAIVQKFKDKFHSSENVPSEDVCLSDDFSGVVAQDLMPKFSNVEDDIAVGSDDIPTTDLTKDSHDLTPAKRVFNEQSEGAADSGSVKTLKKEIKIEKD